MLLICHSLKSGLFFFSSFFFLSSILYLDHILTILLHNNPKNETQYLLSMMKTLNVIFLKQITFVRIIGIQLQLKPKKTQNLPCSAQN